MASTSAAEPSSARKESPNWLEIPHDLILIIFQSLGTMDLLSARRVCTSWRRISNNPAFWKVVYVHKPFQACEKNYNFEMLTKLAVDLSRGELIDISIDSFGSNDLLDYIVLRSNKLKRLSLTSCYNITGSGLSRAVKRLPHLEELCLSITPTYVEDIAAIVQNCPQLKYFMLDKRLISSYHENADGDALAIANNMPELRRLKLISKAMTNKGLRVILNGCPHLEALDVRMCHRLDLHGNLGKLCMERIKDFKSDLTQN